MSAEMPSALSPIVKWVSLAVVYAIHDEQLAEHGGKDGIRDENLLEFALERPHNLLVYGNPPPDLADLAAKYAFAISDCQAFIEGSKRTSLHVTLLFLKLNGFELSASNVDCVNVWSDIGDRRIAEQELADWLRKHLMPLHSMPFPGALRSR